MMIATPRSEPANIVFTAGNTLKTWYLCVVYVVYNVYNVLNVCDDVGASTTRAREIRVREHREGCSGNRGGGLCGGGGNRGRGPSLCGGGGAGREREVLYGGGGAEEVHGLQARKWK